MAAGGSVLALAAVLATTALPDPLPATADASMPITSDGARAATAAASTLVTPGRSGDRGVGGDPRDRGVGSVDPRPDIIVVYVDDMRASDVSVMTNVRRRLVANGVSFTNSIVSTSACCPARATLLSGRYAHNTGVLHNQPPFGGYDAYRSGVQAAGDVLPVWLRDAGYRTTLLGKFMNHYPVPSDPGEIPRGFTDWYGLYEGDVRGTAYGIYRQTSYVVRARPGRGQRPLLDPADARAVYDAPGAGDGQLYLYGGSATHQTEVLMDGAIRAVERQRATSAPMYLNVWLTAPHTGGDAPAVGGDAYAERARPFTTRPAEPELRRLAAVLRRGGDLGPLALDRAGAFDERNVKDKPRWIRRTPALSHREIKDLEIRNALRLASLQSVDRKVAELLTALERSQRRTGRPAYVVFSSDGGYFLGEHRLPYEKSWHYGAATDVPLVIRGPGVRRGVEVSAPVGNIDLAPTLLAMAGVSLRDVDRMLDGRSVLPLTRRSPTAPPDPTWQQRALLLEGFHGRTRNHRYAGVRDDRWVYVEHYAKSNGAVTFHELYDLRDDPGYERNLLHGDTADRHRGTAAAMAATLERLKACAAHECRGTERRAPAGLHTRVSPRP